MKQMPLFSDDFLLSRWDAAYSEYEESGADAVIKDCLRQWADRDATLTETQLEAQFLDLFFKRTWGYWGAGERDSEDGWCLFPQFGVAGAGQTGGRGAADAALGWWNREGTPPVPQVLCEFNDNGEFYLDNVDVGCVIPANKEDLWFLCGILNAPVCGFVFRQTSKPFRGDYLSANRQYISPLPIPKAYVAKKAEVGRRAKELQYLHSNRRDKIIQLRRRLDADQCRDNTRDPEWLWAEVMTVAAWKAAAPANIPVREHTAWVKAQYRQRLDERLKILDDRLRPGATLSVALQDGELSFLIDGAPVVSVFPDAADASFIAAQWRQAARTARVTESFHAKKLLETLLALRIISARKATKTEISMYRSA